MIAQKSDLSSLMAFIGERYTFTQEHYPDLDISSRAKQIFAVRHSALHMMKSTGKIAAEAESADHGGEMSAENLKTATTKMLVNVLKLAEELGISGDELAANVPNVMASA
ncbi:MAG TPA: hypothetical protein VHO23_03415 [Candidatus Paceibacterota bacterium]|nr:hypothetical protein [Candidatus Paceibacterota bacterium]